MANKFNLYNALQEHGFRVSEDNSRCLIRDDFVMECEVLWYGKQKSTLAVEIWFNESLTVCTAYYYEDQQVRRFRPFKTKTHMADKRAYNAIQQTVENKSYEF